MNKLYKGKAKYISVLASAVLLWAVTLYSSANGSAHNFFSSSLTTDTIPKKNIPVTRNPEEPGMDQKFVPRNFDSIKKARNAERLADTNVVITLDTINVRMSKDTLDAPVYYHADDSMVLDIPSKRIILYGKETRVKYIDNELISPHINFDQRKNEVSAWLIRDSLGNVIAFPTFIQGDFKATSDSIRFNMKTGKGITKGTYTQQGEMYVYGEKIKKVDSEVFYAYRGRFTTCNLDTPHFAFIAKKIKFINKKMAFTGPVHPEFEGVPVPVYLPCFKG